MKIKKIKLPFKLKKTVLALGSQTKNTVCFAERNHAYFSPVHQDLSDPGALDSFKTDVKYFLKRKPKVIAFDLHPEYQSTKFAHSLSPITYHLRPIQHHHAHIAACMAENGLKNQKVIGVAFDGTGLGSDNKLWGAEFLCCDYKNFSRAGHFREISLLGGEKAILEPFRVAALWLYLAYKDAFLKLDVKFAKMLNKKKWEVLKRMYLAGFNSPAASSAGRLFDAAASLVLARPKASFEAELAIALEKLALSYELGVISCESDKRGYYFSIIKEGNNFVVDPLPMFKQITSALKAKQPEGKIALMFHYTVAQMIKSACILQRKRNRINKVVLSGGVFQNKLLLRLVLDLLYKEGFIVFTQKQLSCNDSSVSLGQAMIAAA
jgi:hydrogenase maturation protein HypF